MTQRLLQSLAMSIGALALIVSTAHAATVAYEVTFLGGNQWRYDYTVNNSMPSLRFDELTVYFDVNRYSTLASPLAPPGWDPIVIQPDIHIPANGFYDALNLSGINTTGASISEFFVSFDYIFAGTPSSQTYELVDSSTFSIVGSGMTIEAPVVPNPPSTVPEPSSLLLMLLGLASVCAASGFRFRGKTGEAV